MRGNKRKDKQVINIERTEKKNQQNLMFTASICVSPLIHIYS